MEPDCQPEILADAAEWVFIRTCRRHIAPALSSGHAAQGPARYRVSWPDVNHDT